MRVNDGLGEDAPMTGEPQSGDLEEVQRRLREIQSQKRGGMRWNVSKHTAEMALVALDTGHGSNAPVRSGKGRRRKRKKRLL
jgi:hypothetical protein